MTGFTETFVLMRQCAAEINQSVSGSRVTLDEARSAMAAADRLFADDRQFGPTIEYGERAGRELFALGPRR